MRSKKISLVVVPLLLSACSDNKTLKQDVYDNQYDCTLDWNYQLCDKELNHDESGALYIRYIGPQYYANNREVKYKGRVVAAYSQRSSRQPLVSKVVKKFAKSQPIRGGFGRGGGTFGG